MSSTRDVALPLGVQVLRLVGGAVVVAVGLELRPKHVHVHDLVRRQEAPWGIWVFRPILHLAPESSLGMIV